MKVTLYQMILELDNDHLMFRELEAIKTACDNKVPAELYESVYCGELDIKTPEDVFIVFNVAHPEGFKGSSMSVSDVDEFSYTMHNSAFFYCDSPGGFPEIAFDKKKTMSPVANHDFRQEEDIRCGCFQIVFCGEFGVGMVYCSKVVFTRCRYSQCQLGYKLTYGNLNEEHCHEREFSFRPKILIVHTAFGKIPESVLYRYTEENHRLRKFTAFSDENFKAVEQWCMEHNIKFEYL